MLENDSAKISDKSEGDTGGVCLDVVMKNNDPRRAFFSHCLTLLLFNAKIFGVNHVLMIPKIPETVHIRLGTHDISSSMFMDPLSFELILLCTEV